MSDRIDIGHGVSIAPRRMMGETEIEGYEYHHPCLTGNDGGSWIPVNGPKAWTLVTREPLTLTPSMLCTACGHHGWIRDGRWVPA